MPKITNCLWFEKDAEAATGWYVSLFPNSRISRMQRADAQMAAESGQPEGSVIWVSFTLDGEEFIAINGGAQPWAKTSGFISFIIHCKDQAEIDHYWDAFTDGGNPMPCGWITDKHGITWQVVPHNIDSYMESKSATAALFKMEKIIIADLEAAK